MTGNISTFKTVTKSTKLLCYYYFIVCSITCWTSLSLLKIEHANIHICTFNLAKHVFRWTISIVRYWVVQCITRTYLHYIMNPYTYWNIDRSRYRYRYRCRCRYRYIMYMVPWHLGYMILFLLWVQSFKTPNLDEIKENLLSWLAYLLSTHIVGPSTLLQHFSFILKAE